MHYNINNLNNWALPHEAVEWIYKNIPKQSTIVELGSGTGTIELLKYYTVYSIEQNRDWLNKTDSNYIYAPLGKYDTDLPGTTGWYTYTNFFKLPQNYQLLIIDGPVGANRQNFINHWFCFKPDIPILIDDTQRQPVLNMAMKLADIFKKKATHFKGHQKTFTVIQ